MRRLVKVAIAMMLAVVAVLALNPVGAQAGIGRVRPEFFGMHDPEERGSAAYGAIRLWDVGVTWSDVEPAKGEFDFRRLDALVVRARNRHAKITLTLGSTPAWAATDPKSLSAAWLHPGSSSPPRDMGDWVDYVTTVVTRYKGLIDSYQIWNEATLPQFWAGSSTQLARLTTAAYVAIKAVDYHAEVVSTPLLPRQPQWVTWSTAYLKALRRAGWPVDVFAIHSYQPDKLGNPDGRVTVIRQTKALLRSLKAPKRPLWDTEANYSSNAYAKYKITGKRSAEWVARAYLDSLRLGVKRTFWYSFNHAVGHLGVTLSHRNAAARGYSSVRSWLLDANFRGCTTKRAGTRAKVTRCTLRRDGKTSHVVWASANAHTALTGKGKTVCQLLTGCAKRTKKTLVRTSPMLVR